MNQAKALLFAAALLIGAMASADAQANRGYRGHGGHGYYGHGHGHVGVYFGAPFFFPWYYPGAYYSPYYASPYYYPAQAGYPAPPATYVEQAQPEAAPGSGPRSDAYWYYCPGSKAYYPYVNQCAGGWQRVSPQPPPS